MGLQGIDDIYADYHALEAESYTGNLMTNVFGGGTIDTERCFLTGYTQLKDYRRPVNSYVWYLREQGYTANGSHPCLRTFYNRYNVNRYLGFEDYLFTEGYYEKYGYPVTYDEEFFPDMLKFFKDDVADGKNVFSFNVTYQGHGPVQHRQARLGRSGLGRRRFRVQLLCHKQLSRLCKRYYRKAVRAQSRA